METYLNSLIRTKTDQASLVRKFPFAVVLLGFIVLSLLNLFNDSGLLAAADIEWHDIVSQWFVIGVMSYLIIIAIRSNISSRTFHLFFFGCTNIIWIMSIKFFGELFEKQTPLLTFFELAFAVSGLLLITLGLTSWSRDFKFVIDSLRDSTSKYRVLSETDAMTGLLNRGRFDPMMNHEAEQDHDLSLVLVDLDHFKTVNDRFGHPVGDQVIKSTAGILKQYIRDSDYAFRLGGEEFALLYVHCPQELVVERARTIRKAISDEPFSTDNDEVFTVTASLGVVHFEEDEQTAALYRRADSALYQAKSDGRDRVVVL